MPLFTRELNELANYIGRSNWTVWLHTAAPTDADPTNGRTTVGGGAYESGAMLAAADIQDAVNGDIDNDVAVDFGTADEDVGTVTHWSAVRGSDGVVHGTVPNAIIASGDSFSINANTMDLAGSST